LLFKTAFDRGDAKKIKMLLEHGIIPSDDVIAYVRENAKGESDQRILRDLIETKNKFNSDEAFMKSLIEKRWGKVPKDQLAQLLLKEFNRGELQIFGGVDPAFVKNSPAIQRVILDKIKAGGRLTQDQAETFIKGCIFYGLDDLLDGFLRSGVLPEFYEIPLIIFEEAVRDDKLGIVNVLIRSNIVQKPSRERIQQYRYLAAANPNVAYLKNMVDFLEGFYEGEIW
jgi:hypothetical protein